MWSCSVSINWGEWGTIPECLSERVAAAKLPVRQDRLPAARCRHKYCRRRRGCTVELHAKLGLAMRPSCLSVAASSSSSEVSRMDDMVLVGQHWRTSSCLVGGSALAVGMHSGTARKQAAVCKPDSSHLAGAGAAAPAACRLAWAGSKERTIHPTPALWVRCSCHRRHAVLMPELPMVRPLYRQHISASHSSTDSAATAPDICWLLAALSTLHRSCRAASVSCKAEAASAVSINSHDADPKQSLTRTCELAGAASGCSVKAVRSACSNSPSRR